MVVNSLKAFLFTAAGATAAVSTAYVSGALDPYLGTGEAAVMSQPEPASPKSERLPQQAAIEPETGSQAEKAEPAKPALPEPQAEIKPAPETAVPQAAPETAAPVVVAPSFDIVRAEPDGSIVVAGKAAPQAMVEIVAGAKVLGKTKAGADGDFAIVLDEPLKPGGHQLVLRSTAEDNIVATSPETAVVSIPEQTDGQVLALVEKPGEPSKLITVPEPEPVAPKPAAEPQPQVTPPAEAEKTADTSAETKKTADTSPATAEAQKPAAPVKLTAEAPAAKTDAGAGKPVASEMPAQPDGPKVTVDAVEIEGRKVFVAGAADPGRNVRVYANDILLGEAPTSPSGRFLIETERDLPVGDYIIRADALEPNGDKVVARAAVPFEREPGAAVAAVAPDVPNTAKPGASAEPAPVASAPVAAETPEASEPAEPLVAAAPPATTEPPAAATAGQGGTAPPAVEAKPEPQATVAAATPENASPRLENVDGAVIIRRGDTLWKISRRVYGRGVRYSTIYLANQDQIRNPDLIWPGQVFSVPGKTTEGEAADMSAVKEQATTMPPKASQ